MNKPSLFKSRGLRGHFLLRLLAAWGLVAAMLIYISVSFAREKTIEERSRLTATLAENLAANAGYGMLTGDKVILQELINSVRRQENIAWAYIVDVTGATTVLAGFNNTSHEVVFPGSPPPKTTAVEGDFVSVAVPIQIAVKTTGDEALFYSSPGTETSGPRSVRAGYITLGISLKTDLIKLKGLQFSIILLVCFALFLLVGYLYRELTVHIIQPLNRFLEGTAEVAKGNLDYRVRVESTTEIGELAGAFNSAVEKRKEAETEVARHQHHLEEMITERTAQLAESEERIKKLSEAAYEGIVVHLGGTAIDANAQFAKMHGYEMSELIGKDVIELLSHPDDLEMIRKNATSNYDLSFEARAVRKDGTVFPFEVRGRKFIYKGRETRVAVFRDITERKRAEQALREAKEQAENATKMKDQFVSLVSHDLRSPIASQLSFLNYFLHAHGAENREEMEQVIHKATENCNHMLKMIEGLLNINRLRTGTYNLVEIEVPVYSLASSVVNSLAPIAEGKGVVISNEIPPGFTITADGDLFRQVLMNLVSNAIKYCGKNGRITLFVPEGKPRTVAVRDSGTGIPETSLKTIQQGKIPVSVPGTAGEKGTGLGLIFCREIIRKHGGDLDITSVEGEGSTFFIEMPAGPPPD